MLTRRIFDMIYLTAIGWPPGGSSTVQYSTHIHTTNTENDTKQTIHTTTKIRKSAGRAPSLRVLLWHLPYNWGKSTGKPKSG